MLRLIGFTFPSADILLNPAALNMIRTLLVLFSCSLLFSGCSTLNRNVVVQAEAVEVARRQIHKRECWPEAEPISESRYKTVCFQSERHADGHWRILAYPGIAQVEPSRLTEVYDETRLIELDPEGHVLGYSNVTR